MRLTNSYSVRYNDITLESVLVYRLVDNNNNSYFFEFSMNTMAIMLMLFMKMVRILTIYKEAQKGQSCEKA